MNISNFIGPAVAAVVVPLALQAMLRSAKAKAEKREGVSWLEYGWAMKGFSLVFCGAGVAALVHATFFVASKDKSAVLAIAGLLLGLTIPLAIEFFLVRIGFDDEHIFCFSGWRRTRVIAWSDVTSARFSRSMQWWVVKTRNSGKIRVHAYLSGVPDFLEQLEARRVRIRE